MNESDGLSNSSAAHSNFTFHFYIFQLSILIFLFFCHLPVLADEDFTLDKEVSLSSDILETLEELKGNPLDLNSATYNEFLQIPYITPLLATRIENYRKKKGPFSRKDDLLQIAGFNKPLLDKVEPYITVKAKALKIPKGKIQVRTTFSKKLPEKEGYTGDAIKLSNKLKYEQGPLMIGGGTYKDSYERNYLDFYTLYCYYQQDHYSIIIGDYAIAVGEGLISGYPGFVFKSSGIIKGKEYFIRPYFSGFEDYSLRGAALRKKLGSMNAGLFVSHKKEDATIEDGVVKTVKYETGYHRTETEEDKKDRIQEKLLGGNLEYKNSDFQLSMTSLVAYYHRKVEPDSTHYFRFCGDKYGVAGAHTVYNMENLSFWSEFSHSLFSQANGFILGTSFSPQKTSISILYRDYSEEYYSPRAFSFCENEVRNERGLYTYVRMKLPSRLYFSGYIDIFKRPYATYFNPLSTEGYGAFSSVEKRLGKTSIYLRYKRKEKNSHLWNGNNLKYERQNVRIGLESKLEKGTIMKAIWEGTIYYVPYINLQDKGNLISFLVRTQISDNSRFETGIVFFETDSYNSRLYLFINDIPGSMNIKPFYGSGKDFYVLMKSRLMDKLRIYGKVEIMQKEETEKLYSAGLEWR